ncbi:MAG TPA: ATP-binding protein [Caulobacteraceae bacterium]|nr:ATP-binding protein [Caulobacteraceae bacterium]
MAAPADALTSRSLAAQRALMPAALALFAIGLPIFVWVGAYAANAPFMAACLATFAINCAAFYLTVGWLERNPLASVAARLRIHVLAALLWSGAVGEVAAFAAGAGPAREPLLMLACGAAAMCLFFLSPSLPALLIAGPAAAAGPLLEIFADPGSRFVGFLAWGGFALAFLLMLILNHAFRTQFALAAEAQALAADRAASLERAETLAASRSALVAALSREVRDGLAGLVQMLVAAAAPSVRGGAAKIAAALTAARELQGALEATIDSQNAEAGALSTAEQAFDAVAVVRGLEELWRPQAGERGLEFSVFVDPALDRAGAAIGDPARVAQIVGHLIANAVRYTHRGRVEARLELASARTLAISVVDTGPGLATDELERAFAPFARIERTSSGVSGAGLGLSLSRQLAQLMGCALEARSAMGVGSAFTLVLPLDPERAPDETPAQPAAGDIPSRALRVLLAEPDELAAALTRQRIEELGHGCVLARSLERAFDLLAAGPADAVLVAAGLIEADPAAALARLRDAGVGPVIVVTDGEASEAGSAGAEAVLRRPVTLAALARVLARAPRRSLTTIAA